MRVLRDGDESFVHELGRRAQHHLVVRLVKRFLRARNILQQRSARGREERLHVGLSERTLRRAQLRSQGGQLVLDGATLALQRRDGRGRGGDLLVLARSLQFELSNSLSQLLLQSLHRVFLRRADCTVASEHVLERLERRQSLGHEFCFLELGLINLAAQRVEAGGVVGQKILHLLTLETNLSQTVGLR